MNQSKKLWSGLNRTLLLAVGLLVAALYIWQVAGAWAADQSQAGYYDLGLGSRGLLSGRGPQAMSLTGQGIASGATGRLLVSVRGMSGILELHDMPALPDSQVYQLWCVDGAGTIDAANSFLIPIDGQESTILVIGAPRMLMVYTHFMITIEPAGSSSSPSKQVVMVD
jgi:Anti-sigma-K factor rskA